MNQKLTTYYTKWYEHLASLRAEIESGAAVENVLDQHPDLRDDLLANIDALQISCAAAESLARRAPEESPEPPAVTAEEHQHPAQSTRLQRAAAMFAGRG